MASLLVNPDDIPEIEESQDEIKVTRKGKLLKTIRANVRYGSGIGWFIKVETSRIDVLLALERLNDNSFLVVLP